MKISPILLLVGIWMPVISVGVNLITQNTVDAVAFIGGILFGAFTILTAIGTHVIIEANEK